MENIKKNFIFDLDDTLIPTQYKYNAAFEKLYKYFVDFFDRKITDKTQVQKDMTDAQLNVVANVGLIRTNYIMSAEEVFLMYCDKYGKKATIREINDVLNIASTCFDGDAELFEGCVEVFEYLKAKGHDLYILTSGDVIIQKYKIFTSGLYKYFDNEHIIIAPIKNTAVYEENFKELGFGNCIMVGNSLSSDIKPALEVGMQAIHIPAKTWVIDHAIVNECSSLHTVRSIVDVIKICDNILKCESSVA